MRRSRGTICRIAGCALLGFISCTGKGEVLARAGGKVITVEDFQEELGRLPPYLRQRTKTDDGKRELLDQMILRKLMISEAEGEGLRERSDIRKEIKNFEERVLVQKLLEEKVTKAAAVSDEEAGRYYQSHPEEFKDGEKVKAFTEVKDDIKRKLAPARQRDVYDTYIKGLRERKKIAVNEGLLKKL